MQHTDRESSTATPEPPLPPAVLPGVCATRPREVGGPPGPEPTRFGDWENKGRCIDF
jgi:Protein of unknown function (DUF1674)